MPQKQDIESRKDIELLVDTFYEKVLKDETIGYIFSEIANIDLAKHMPLMYDFWETTLFHKANYKGNPMKVHVDLNE
ncbi:MAG: group III truncated hemoglobin, partial [Cyclobacteriaceae bacterium]|nr:group III truncated hemoglobin [Cyclobacteriaceae bacterium]